MSMKAFTSHPDELYESACQRMRYWLEQDGPPPLIRNEARQMLATQAGSAWKAIRQWAWEEIRKKVSVWNPLNRILDAFKNWSL